jgi:hypothetical protein
MEWELTLGKLPLGHGHYEVERAGHFSYIVWHDLLTLGDNEWRRLFRQGWFPLLGLPYGGRRMVECARDDREVDAVCLAGAMEHVKHNPGDWTAEWAESGMLRDHIDVIKSGAERYLAGDMIPACTNVYPRLESVMRAIKRAHTASAHAKHGDLIRWVLGGGSMDLHGRGPLVPKRFHEFLSDVMSGEFDPADPQGVSRHTVSHGVARADQRSMPGNRPSRTWCG